MSLAEVLPGDPVVDPLSQVISSEELRSLVECLGEPSRTSRAAS